jgi:hypothetical protein
MLAASGCASLEQQPRTIRSDLAAPKAEAHSRDVLTSRDLTAHPTLQNASLYDAIAALRPEYFSILSSPRARVAPISSLLIVDGAPRGGVDDLRSLNAAMIAEIRLVRPAESLVRYGKEYHAGAIVITTIVEAARTRAPMSR